jgi:hypothetical protein
MDIMTSMKEKLRSPSTHSLIVLVARSGWPFVCATRALFPLTLSFLFFNHADGRWQWWSNPRRLNQHEPNDREKNGWFGQHKRRKIEREISRTCSATKRVCTTGDTLYSLALHVCLGFLSFLFFTSSNAFRSSMTATTYTHTHNASAAQCLERTMSLSSSGRAKLFFSWFFFHTDLLVRRWHTYVKDNSTNPHTHTYALDIVRG